MKKIAFIISNMAGGMTGGAEVAMLGLTEHLFAAGVDLEILTTCAGMDYEDWGKNIYPSGLSEFNGVPVRRFPVLERYPDIFDSINLRLLNGDDISEDERKTFLGEFIKSPDLIRFIKDNTDNYSFFCFIPYISGTTYLGALACPGKSVLIPCLHDEHYAYLPDFRDIFCDAGGIICLSEPESELVCRLYNMSKTRTAVLGIGVDTDIKGKAERFRNKFGIFDPFILYVGRKNAEKGICMLLDGFQRWKEQRNNNVKLVLIGRGKVADLPGISDDVIDLGFLDNEDVYDAFAAAEFLCQPSKNESFSLVIMQSWINEKPVLVSEACAVTTDFVKKANGGLYFGSYPEFALCLDYLLSHPVKSRLMGKNGREYVLANFSWDIITEKYKKFFSFLDERKTAV